jgi:Putative Actinobacterial Holin-X, holin superfamily III
MVLPPRRTYDMLAPSGDLLRAGVGLKINQIKRATRSYLRDRTDQATGTMASYAVAAGMFAAAGIFLIAAILVGTAALFRWVEIEYGLFQAFGAVCGLLLAIAAVCAVVAASKLKPREPNFPSLTSRLRVAIKASPIRSGQIEAARDTTAAVPRVPASPVLGSAGAISRSQTDLRNGLILMVSLMGLAAVKRRQQARRPGL